MVWSDVQVCVWFYLLYIFVVEASLCFLLRLIVYLLLYVSFVSTFLCCLFQYFMFCTWNIVRGRFPSTMYLIFGRCCLQKEDVLILNWKKLKGEWWRNGSWGRSKNLILRLTLWKRENIQFPTNSALDTMSFFFSVLFLLENVMLLKYKKCYQSMDFVLTFS